MKTLQKDLTTPEQSKRLLELGVPADSANFSMTENGKNVEMLDGILYSEFIKRVPQNYSRTRFLPCWSVGRLIEIHAACAGTSSSYYIHTFPTNIMNEVMWHFVEAIKKGWINFSKLED